jgi:hypothetical protein
MGVTGSSAETVYATEQPAPDYDRPIPTEELVAALAAQTRRLGEGERVEEDAYPNNAFGI